MLSADGRWRPVSAADVLHKAALLTDEQARRLLRVYRLKQPPDPAP
jgi:hypothetical protein